MVFSSLEFIFFFLPAFLLIYFITPWRLRNFVLFIGSMVFYSLGTLDQPEYILLLLLSITVNYSLARAMDGRRRGFRKFLLTIGLIYDFGWLFLFKYADFFLSGVNAVVQAAAPESSGIQPLGLTLPIGISFYTFQIASYLIDVYRGKFPAERNFIDLGAYISMYPQLIAGPIVTYGQVLDKMKKRTVSSRAVVSGLQVFIFGLGLKVLLANRVAGLWTALSTIGYESVSTPLAWLGLLGFTFQIYFDFFGYSLMAIGLGRMLGFQFPMNFRHPYLSLSMTEFWRRWHITLGAWFREYVYIPLGGSRRGTGRTIFNLLMVWLLTGLWHGAHLNFLIWGLIIFVFIAIEKLGLKSSLDRRPALGHIYMIFLIPITWAVFQITDLSQLGLFFSRLFPFLPGETAAVFAGDFSKYLSEYWYLLLACLLFCTRLPYRLFSKGHDSILGTIFLLAVFWGSVYCMYKGLNDPFLYFRF